MRKTSFYCMLVMCCFMLVGCGKKADESKPVSEVKAEAEKMSVEQLRATAMKYKEAILAKGDEVDKIVAELKKIPVTKMLGEEAKQLKAEIDNLNKSVTLLKERFQIYYNKLKEKNGDLSGLEL